MHHTHSHGTHHSHGIHQVNVPPPSMRPSQINMNVGQQVPPPQHHISNVNVPPPNRQPHALQQQSQRDQNRLNTHQQHRITSQMHQQTHHGRYNNIHSGPKTNNNSQYLQQQKTNSHILSANQNSNVLATHRNNTVAIHHSQPPPTSSTSSSQQPLHQTIIAQNVHNNNHPTILSANKSQQQISQITHNRVDKQHTTIQQHNQLHNTKQNMTSNHKIIKSTDSNCLKSIQAISILTTTNVTKSTATTSISSQPLIQSVTTTSSQPSTNVGLSSKQTSVQILPRPQSPIIEVSANDGDSLLPITILNDNSGNNSGSTKEKTPMCLVNELARFNKIQHQYRLTSEHGPAHKKRFTVTLKLGEEEYTSDGASIKKAQHAAAGEAIGKTKYKHPPAKTNRIKINSRTGPAGTGHITPTVELNALAMKRGEMTIYEFNPPASANTVFIQQMTNQQQQQYQYQGGVGTLSSSSGGILLPQQQSIMNQGRNFRKLDRNNGVSITTTMPYSGKQRSGYDNRLDGGLPMINGSTIGGGATNRNYSKSYKKPNNFNAMSSIVGTVDDPFKVTLQVGQRKFIGIGNTLQSARHDAAAKALQTLKPITPADDGSDIELDEDLSSETKSPISLVHEMALKRNMTVGFEVQSEKGPPHMKTFITLCIVGNITTEGEGNGKRLSKKRAAETMLAELKKLPPLSPVENIGNNNAVGSSNDSGAGGGISGSSKAKQFKRNKMQTIKKKTRNLIKEMHPDDENEDINPISHLIHIAQGNKSKDPVYTLIEEKGAPRRREFVIEVSAVGQKAQGTGSTKRYAKRQAAENLLTILGLLRTALPNKDGSPISSANGNTVGEQTEKIRKVKFQDKPETMQPQIINHGGSGGRQLVPGLLLVQQENSGFCTTTTTNINKQQTATIAKELLHDGTSPTADALAKNGCSMIQSPKQNSSSVMTPAMPPTTTEVLRPKDQLMYLATLLGFQIQFSDFPKGNHGEYLTLVTLSTEPPQLCHGAGPSTDASHDQAALTALKMLSELGLDNVKPKPIQEEKKIKPILSNGIKK